MIKNNEELKAFVAQKQRHYNKVSKLYNSIARNMGADNCDNLKTPNEDIEALTYAVNEIERLQAGWDMTGALYSVVNEELNRIKSITAEDIAKVIVGADGHACPDELNDFSDKVQKFHYEQAQAIHDLLLSNSNEFVTADDNHSDYNLINGEDNDGK